MKKNIRFFIVLYLAKIARLFLKILGRDATNFPGKLAIMLCPDFLGRIDKPTTIVAVTGTNGKTTVCNIIEDFLRANNYDFLDNHTGSNINSGIASSLIYGATLSGKQKKDLAIFEIDERSSKKIYPYLTPTYLVCTNLSRDSLKRHAHVEYISEILTNAIPKDTKLILNGDDLIASGLAPENDRVYFGISRLETDTDKCENIVRDISTCPKCDTLLEFDFVRYNHIGRAHCPNCDFKSPEINYEITKIDFDNMKINLHVTNAGKEADEHYNIISNNIINIYNTLIAISVLKELGFSRDQINPILKEQKIVDTRYSEEDVNGIKIITQLAKGLNPVACSRAFDYVRKESGNKAVFVILDDLHEAAHLTENITWYYDTDYEFLNSDSIKQVLIAGVRHLDTYVRLEMADIPKNKIVHQRDEVSLVDKLNLQGIDKIFILYDLYSIDLKNQIKEKIKEKINGKDQNH